MGKFTDLLGQKPTEPIQLPQYAKPDLNTNLKISAPTGKELGLEQLPAVEQSKARADIRTSELQASGKKSGFLQMIAQSFPRAVVSFGLEFAKGGEAQATPQTKFEKILYGEEPIKSVSQRGIEGAPLAEKFVGQKASVPVSTAVVFGLTALDLTPFGGTRKGLAKEIVEAGTDDVAKALLKKAGVADDLAEAYAGQVVKATTKKEAETIIARLDDLAKTTKVAPIVSKTDDLLTQEARKYKSAEEFVKAVKGSATQYGEYNPSVRANIPAGYKNITEMGIDPEKTVTIYRGIDNISGKVKREINDGDFVTTDFDSALSYTGNPKDVVEMEVKAKHLYNSEPRDFTDEPFYTGAEYIYTTKNAKALPSESQLTDIWNEATKIAPEAKKGVRVKPTTLERGFITSAKEAVPEANKIAGQYVPRSTDNLAIKAKNLIKTDLNTAEKLALTGTDENAVATASELLKHYASEAEKATSPAIKNALYDKAAQVANTIAPKLTEQGRNIQAASILGRLTPEGQVKFAASQIAKYNEALPIAKRIPELTGEQANKIVNEMKAINAMPKGNEQAIRFKKLQDYITTLVPTPLFKKVIAVWKAGLLTGLKTSGVNIFANTSHMGTELAKDIPATVVDKVVSLFTGKRTVAFTVRGLTGGAKEGVEKGLQYLRTGFDERNIATKLDYEKVNFGKGKIAQALQAYTDTVFRVLGSEDQPFYYAAKLRSLYEQAKVQAINKGLKGKEAQKFIDNLIQNPTDEMIKFASTDAEMAVFQNPTVLSKAATGITKAVPGAEIIIPFRKTPSAVAMQIFNYSPAGAVKAIFENVGKGKFDQRLFSKAMGRALTGTGALALGAYMFKKGIMTTARPTSEKERELWRLEGKIPNAIKIGNKWRQVQFLGPIGNVLLMGGSFQKAFDSSGSPTGAMAKGLADASQSFTQQTFLTGVSNFVDAISDPARSAEYVAGSTLASSIPTIVSDIARATDKKERRTENIWEKIIGRIPGVRQTLQPQVDVLGKEIESVGNPLEIMADPTRPSKSKETPVILELRRLWDSGVKVSPTLLGDKEGYKGLTNEQNTELWKRAGQILDSKLGNLIKSENYQKADDEKKGKVIEDFVDKSKLVARAEIVVKLTNGLEGDVLKNRLSELKKSGVMTKEVFNKYLEIR